MIHQKQTRYSSWVKNSGEEQNNLFSFSRNCILKSYSVFSFLAITVCCWIYCQLNILYFFSAFSVKLFLLNPILVSLVFEPQRSFTLFSIKWHLSSLAHSSGPVIITSNEDLSFSSSFQANTVKWEGIKMSIPSRYSNEWPRLGKNHLIILEDLFLLWQLYWDKIDVR